VRMLPTAPTAPALLDLHNVCSAWHAAAGRDAQATAARALEMEALQRVDAVTTCSDLESRRLREQHPDLSVPAFTAPLGVDPEEWPAHPFDRAHPRVALFGGWTWEPNRRGLAWFIDEVWPRVTSAIGEAEAIVAGSGAASDPTVRGITVV